MKKRITILVALILALGKAQAQTHIYCPGDSIYLGLASYRGNLQWQQSTDSLNWTNISGATFSPYGFVFESNNYYRAMITDGTCNPIYSPVQFAKTGNCQPQPSYAPASVFCNAPTYVNDVLNPFTGKTWMDRNLGASQAATSSTDSLSYGDFFQWGRRADGHQCRNSLTVTELSSSSYPAHGDFIINSNDWLSPQNNNLWKGVLGVNNPCPNGYRLPTETELSEETASWANYSSPFESPLKFPLSGNRWNDGSINNVGTSGFYWTSISPPTIISQGTSPSILVLDNSTGSILSNLTNRSEGNAIRCIKEKTATISELLCNKVSTFGNLFEGTPTINYSFSLPYSGGNSGYYSPQSFNSTGVLGLTAHLTLGLLSEGAGTVIFSVTGTPSSNGIADFNLSLGGKNCIVSLIVQKAHIFCNGPTTIVDVVSPVTGAIWMDRNIGATQAAISEDDTLAFGDLYQWGRRSDGHQCRNSATTTSLSSVDQPTHGDFILTNEIPYDWRTPENAAFWQGVSALNSPCPSGYRLPTEIEFNAESSTLNSGLMNSFLKLPNSGYRYWNDGIVYNGGAYFWTSSISMENSKAINCYNGAGGIFSNINERNRTEGLSVRCIKDKLASVESINCNNSGVLYDNFYENAEANNFKLLLIYNGGNGGYYFPQFISSSGVLGLTATLPAGYLANGSDTLTYFISGIPQSTGIAYFNVKIGDKECNLAINILELRFAYEDGYNNGSVFCNGPTPIINAVNPITGQIWMDRNLGAYRVASSFNDTLAYGDLYQWGRARDGHQCRNSPVYGGPYHSGILAASNSFYTSYGNSTTSPYQDWSSSPNNNLWQKVNDINNTYYYTNNPCPIGYHIPTDAELNTLRLSWSSNNTTGAFSSPLKLPAAGYRSSTSGGIINNGIIGYYWSSTINSTYAKYLNFNNTNAGINNFGRAGGFSVRCIKD